MACFQIASTLSDLQVSLFSGHPSVQLLLWVDTERSAALASCTGRVCLQSHVYQYIQWDEASLLPTEYSDEAVPFFLRGHTDLRARGEKGKDSVQQELVGNCSRSYCRLSMQEHLAGRGERRLREWEVRGGGRGGSNVRKRSIKHDMQTWVWKQAQMQNIFWVPAL